MTELRLVTGGILLRCRQRQPLTSLRQSELKTYYKIAFHSVVTTSARRDSNINKIGFLDAYVLAKGDASRVIQNTGKVRGVR